MSDVCFIHGSAAIKPSRIFATLLFRPDWIKPDVRIPASVFVVMTCTSIFPFVVVVGTWLHNWRGFLQGFNADVLISPLSWVFWAFLASLQSPYDPDHFSPASTKTSRIPGVAWYSCLRSRWNQTTFAKSPAAAGKPLHRQKRRRDF